MDTERYERLVGIMAAMAAGDPAAVFWLYAEFGGHVGAAMRRELRRLGVERVAPEELDGMVIDACFELFDCAAAWDPTGGALPWTWAGRRLRRVASAWVGQHADELDVERFDAGADARGPTLVDDEAELDVLSRLAERHAGCALVLDALEHVATRRDRAIVLEVRVQMASGDPSPALTVARRHGLTPEVVRQVVCRVRARLNRLAACDDRFASLADVPLVA
ncbi:MAG: hypothetical protein KY458_14715 [Actinobacteria bacterium]|nr:hypothetical protein [Actinomycetota bacterium]